MYQTKQERAAVALAKRLLVSEKDGEYIEENVLAFLRAYRGRHYRIKRDTLFEVTSEAVDWSVPILLQIRRIMEEATEDFFDAAKEVGVEDPEKLLRSLLGEGKIGPIENYAINRAAKLANLKGVK